MYVAAKGGERAIENAHRLLARERRGDLSVPELSLEQIQEQLTLAVDRVMNEGSLYDRELAALAIKQARGDLIEAIFLLRAFRATLPRFGATEPIDSSVMTMRRRVSATFKDLPGGQILGPTFDYTHRLLEFPTEESSEDALASAEVGPDPMPRVTDLLAGDDLIEKSPHSGAQDRVGDLTQDPLSFPTNRDVRLQNLARGDEGFLLALGYSTQRGYGRNHPFVGEIRLGEVQVEFVPEEIGFAVPLGCITVTECQMVNQFRGSAIQPPRFTRGYGGFWLCVVRRTSDTWRLSPTSSPIFFGLTSHRRRTRVLHFHPMSRTAGAIWRADALGHDPFAAERASVFAPGIPGTGLSWYEQQRVTTRPHVLLPWVLVLVVVAWALFAR